MIKDADYWIEKLGLSPHPEGGYWVQTYRSSERIAGGCLPDRFNGTRIFSSAIYYLLKGNQISAFHRIKADELWHYYAGSSVILYAIDEAGTLIERKLGSNPETGESFQVMMKAECWFGAKVDDLASYSLVGCTVAPGFEFDDFEIGDRSTLIGRFPRHRSIIEQLTK
jgi:predicted cupin superfamily sugar epimerase